jgi:hypothetical protein
VDGVAKFWIPQVNSSIAGENVSSGGDQLYLGHRLLVLGVSEVGGDLGGASTLVP